MIVEPPIYLACKIARVTMRDAVDQVLTGAGAARARLAAMWSRRTSIMP